jgi:hypothetical protein
VGSENKKVVANNKFALEKVEKLKMAAGSYRPAAPTTFIWPVAFDAQASSNPRYKLGIIPLDVDNHMYCHVAANEDISLGDFVVIDNDYHIVKATEDANAIATISGIPKNSFGTVRLLLGPSSPIPTPTDVNWGDITGNIDDQGDLEAALATSSKSSKWGNITGKIDEQTDLKEVLDTSAETAKWSQISGNIEDQEDLFNIISSLTKTFQEELDAKSDIYETTVESYPLSTIRDGMTLQSKTLTFDTSVKLSDGTEGSLEFNDQKGTGINLYNDSDEDSWTYYAVLPDDTKIVFATENNAGEVTWNMSSYAFPDEELLVEFDGGNISGEPWVSTIVSPGGEIKVDCEYLYKSPSHAGAVWGNITGNIEDQADLQAEFANIKTSAVWGQITGTLSSQADLNTALTTSAKTSQWGNISGTFTEQSDLVTALTDASEKAIWGDITGLLSSQTDLNTALTNSSKTATWSQISGDITKQADLQAEFANIKTSAVWGQITGTLSSQTDLNTALTNSAKTATWSQISGDITKQADLQAEFANIKTSAVWGQITGTLSSQTDLNTALTNSAKTSQWGQISGDITQQSDLQAALSKIVHESTWGAISGNIDDQTDLKSKLDNKSDIYHLPSSPILLKNVPVGMNLRNMLLIFDTTKDLSSATQASQIEFTSGAKKGQIEIYFQEAGDGVFYVYFDNGHPGETFWYRNSDGSQGWNMQQYQFPNDQDYIVTQNLTDDNIPWNSCTISTAIFVDCQYLYNLIESQRKEIELLRKVGS